MNPNRLGVQADGQHAQQDQRFDWVILDIKKGDWPPFYIQVENINVDSQSFYPLTGAPMQPKSLLAKNPFAYGGQLPLNQDLFEKLFVEGWSPPEKWGRQLVGDRSVVRVAIVRAAYQISIEMRPACVDGHPLVSEVIVGWDDQILGKNVFTTCESDSFKFDLSKDLIKKRGYNDLWLKCERAVSRPNANLNAGADSPNAIVTSIDFIKN